MARLYAIDDRGQAAELPAIHCKNEDLELQQLLEKNPHLLPGDQIDPDDPRRWLLVKREMPVEHPGTGTPWWSVDLFLMDQGATPTFVECKRHRDTRARREVVAQMLEYAANGHYYWDVDLLRNHAAATAGGEARLEAAVRRLQGEEFDSVDAFFERAQRHLREGRVRLIFLLEEAPPELKSIVDFLNRQMERTEVLLVEARQYQCDDTRLVLPSLFGFTEEARRAKRAGRATSGSENRRRWDEASFFTKLAETVEPSVAAAVEQVYRFGQELDLRFNWGTGSAHGSFNLIQPRLCQRSFLSVRTDGVLSINDHWFRDTPEAASFIDQLRADVAQTLGLDAPPPGANSWNLAPALWTGAVQELIGIVRRVLGIHCSRGGS